MPCLAITGSSCTAMAFEHSGQANTAQRIFSVPDAPGCRRSASSLTMFSVLMNFSQCGHLTISMGSCLGVVGKDVVIPFYQPGATPVFSIRRAGRRGDRNAQIACGRLRFVASRPILKPSLRQAGGGTINPEAFGATAPSNRSRRFFTPAFPPVSWRGARGHLRVRRTRKPGFDRPAHPATLFSRSTERGGFHISFRSHP